MTVKRLFLGFEVDAPWFKNMPKGRMVAPESRHLTLAFLGEIDCGKRLKHLEHMPVFPCKVGAAGICKELIYLPVKKPNAVALSFKWLTQEELVLRFQQELTVWLQTFGYLASSGESVFLPHVTLARRPFQTREWTEIFYPLPMITTHLHLYESVGQLCYKPIWSKRVLQPISRMVLPQNTCTAFHLMANSYKDLWIHAWLGVSFIYPQVILENFSDCVFEDLEGVEEKLNSILKDFDIESHVILDKVAVVQEGILSCKMFVNASCVA